MIHGDDHIGNDALLEVAGMIACFLRDDEEGLHELQDTFEGCWLCAASIAAASAASALLNLSKSTGRPIEWYIERMVQKAVSA